MKFEKVSKEEWLKAINPIVGNKTHSELLFCNAVNEALQTTGNEDDISDFFYSALTLPKRSTVGSAGYDFSLPFTLKLYPGEMITVATGIKWTSGRFDASAQEDNYYLSIYPRSSLGRDYSLREPNIVSIIDQDYYNNASNEGIIHVNLKNEGTNGVCVIPAYHAYAQGIIQRFFLTDDDHTERIRKGGFGSTDI